MGARERAAGRDRAGADRCSRCSIAPDKPRDLGSQDFTDIAIVATHVYFLAYAFALILCAVAEYFVSAKRFADRGKPAALAGLAPFALLLAARRTGTSRVRRARCRKR